MRCWQVISVVLVPLSCIVFPAWSFSEVKISLKNGRNIIADSCRDTKDRLICEKMGGTFEIEQQDILDVKWITIERESSRHEDLAQEAAPVEEQKKESGEMTDARAEDPEKPPALTSEGKIKLARITQRKLELKGEREELLRERELLQQEIKKADASLTIEKFNALQKKSDDLDARIKKFSSELKALNEEESGLLRGPQQTP